MAEAYAYLVAIIMASIRWGCVIAALPFMSGRSFPVQVRLILILLSGVTFYPLTLSFAQMSQGAGDVLYAVLAELAVGASMALIVMMGFAIVIIAGDIISMVSGLSFALLIDPQGQEAITPFTKMLSLMGMALFIESQSIGSLLELVGQSYKSMSFGHFPRAVQLELLLQGFGGFLLQAFFLSLPFVAVFLLANFALGFLSRSVPQINQIIVGLPGSILLLLLMFLFCFSFVQSEIVQQHIFWLSRLEAHIYFRAS